MAKRTQESGMRWFEGWTFTKKNYVLFGIGLFTIILGYVIMAAGEVNSFQALTLAPILLFLGYAVIIPAALIYREKTKETTTDSSAGSREADT